MAQNREEVVIDVKIKGSEAIVGYKKDIILLNKELKNLKDKLKNNKGSVEENSRAMAQAETQLKKVNRQYKEEQKALTSSNKAKKNAGSFTMKMAKAFGVAQIATQLFTRAMQAVGQAVKSAITTFKDFEFQMAKVKAISGASDKEFKKLVNSAKELGRTTFFTASQVGELQLNLSKLGFRPQEILEAQESILMLSTAMGEDLGRTATVLASTLRGFGEDTDQTARFADAMAAAFSNSALDIEKFQTSMSKVSAIAAMAGFSFEETTGLLALLTNRGIEASIAGTSLRNIFLHLQDPTSDLTARLGRTVSSGEDLIVALQELSSSGIDVAGVMGIVDRRQVMAMNSFIDGADTLTDFNAIMTSSSGTGEKMAEIMEGTLGGAMLKLKSAWEGLTLAVMEGGGFMQTVIEGLVTNLNFYADKWATAEQKVQQIISQSNKDVKAILKDQTDFLSDKSDEDKEIYTQSQSDIMRSVKEGMAKRLEFLKEEVEQTKKSNRIMLAIGDSVAEDKVALAERNLQAQQKAITEFSEAIISQEKKQVEAAKDAARQAEIDAANLAREAEMQSSLIQIEKDKLEQAKLMSEVDEKAIADKNITIQGIEIEIKRLKQLGIEKAKAGGLNLTAAGGDGKITAVESTQQVINNRMFDLQKQFIDGTIETEKDFNAQMLQMQIEAIETALEFDTLSANEKMRLTDMLHKHKMTVAKNESKVEVDRIAQMKETGQLLMQIGTAEGENSKIKAAGIKISQAAAVASGIDGLINAEVGIAQQAKLPFPANIIAMASTAAAVISVISNIKALMGGSGGGGGSDGEATFTRSKFASGGLTSGGMFSGNSHANGGVKFAVGGRVMEAEGGEAIINKRSTSAFRPILSAINSYNGNGVRFADGGLINSGEKFAMGGELKNIQQIISGGAGSQKVVMVESDVTITQNKVSALESQSSF